MLTESTRKILCSKAHIFEAHASFCCRCGCSVDDALSTPFRCKGVKDAEPAYKRPMTLNLAINTAENPHGRNGATYETFMPPSIKHTGVRHG